MTTSSQAPTESKQDFVEPKTYSLISARKIHSSSTTDHVVTRLKHSRVRKKTRQWDMISPIRNNKWEHCHVMAKILLKNGINEQHSLFSFQEQLTSFEEDIGKRLKAGDEKERENYN